MHFVLDCQPCGIYLSRKGDIGILPRRCHFLIEMFGIIKYKVLTRKLLVRIVSNIFSLESTAEPLCYFRAINYQTSKIN